MIFGFNTDVPGKGSVYHVQTEDQGEANPVVDSVISVGGKIVDRVRTPYVPQEVNPTQIAKMIHKQHWGLVDSIRSGTFSPSGRQTLPAMPLLRGYAVRLLNSGSLSRGEQLVFAISVWSRTYGVPAQYVSVDARWVKDGVVSQRITGETDENGHALLSFATPNDSTEGGLLIAAAGPEGRELAKFRLRTVSKPATLEEPERGRMAMRAGAGK